jgi:hypothetical protein
MRDFYDSNTGDLFPKPQKPQKLWLGSRPLYRNSDPSTSFVATQYTNVGRLEQEVLWAVSHYPDGCIYDDVIALLPNRRVHSIQPRFAPLIRKGLLRVLKEKRMGKSGRLQRVIQVV